MKKFLLIIAFCFSSSMVIGHDLTGKTYLCSKLLWGFEFVSSNKVNVISTDINNKTNVKQYYYKTHSELPYVNLYLSQNDISDVVFSIHHQTLRVDIWTMTSGGNTTREIIPAGYCKDIKTKKIVKHIEDLKNSS